MEMTSEGPIAVSNCLELLGYNEPNTSQEEISDSSNDKVVRKERKLCEKERRKRLDDAVTKLAAEVTGPPMYAKRPALHKCITLARTYIKNLKIENNNLEAERYWLIHENRVLLGRLTVLEVQCKLPPTYSTRLWEEGRPKLCTNIEWDAVAKDTPIDTRVHTVYFNSAVENVRKLKTQLHAEFRRRNPIDAFQEKMEEGTWCSDGNCAGAPHQIHAFLGQDVIGDSSVKQPESVKEDDDKRWLEDMPKKKDKGCLGEKVNPSCACPRKKLCNCTAEKSKTAAKRKNDDPPPEMRKGRTDSSSAKKQKKEKKKNKEKKKKKKKEKKKDREKESNSKARYSPSTLHYLKNGLAETTNMVNKGSKLIVDESGKVIGLDSADSVLSGKQLYVLQMGNNQEKASKASSNLQVNLVPLTPGNAVLVYQPTTSGESTAVPRSTTGQAPVLHVRPLYTPISLSTSRLDSSQGIGQAGPKLFYESNSPGRSQPGEVTQNPSTVPGSIGLDLGKRRGDFVLVPASSTSGFAKAALMKGKTQSGPGPMSVQSQDTYKGISHKASMTAPRASDVGYHHPTLMNVKSYTVPGSLSVTDVNPRGVRQEHFTMEPTASNRHVGHHQTTVINNKPYVAPTTANVFGLNMNSGNGQVHSISVPVTASASSRYHYANAMTNKPCTAPGSVSVPSFDPTKGRGQECFTEAPVVPGVGYHQSAVSSNEPYTALRPVSVLGLDPSERTGQQCLATLPEASRKHVRHHQTSMIPETSFTTPYQECGSKRFSTVPVSPDVGHMEDKSTADPRSIDVHGLGYGKEKAQEHLSMSSVCPSITDLLNKELNNTPSVLPGSVSAQSLDPCEGIRQEHFTEALVASNSGYQHLNMNNKSCTVPQTVSVPVMDLSTRVGQERSIQVPVASSAGHSHPKVMSNKPCSVHGSASIQGLDPDKGFRQRDFTIVSFGPNVLDPLPTMQNKPYSAPGSVRALDVDSNRGNRLELFRKRPVNVIPGIGYNQAKKMKSKSLTALQSSSTSNVDPSRGCGQASVGAASSCANVGQSTPKVSTHEQCASESERPGNLDAWKITLPPNVKDHQTLGTKGFSQVKSRSVDHSNEHVRSSAVNAQTNANVSPHVAFASEESPKASAKAEASEEVDKSSSPVSCMLCDKPFNNVKELQAHLVESHTS
ncbi:uncharacterized protein LOC121429610 [Lytechinus variegatus]|uniref:uncharacterized protein LOC121429610 n=1 Tax=Lytechinus variegatus TaxID=7654 RepID=UPI001BB2806C|nr:uncharacterized protein LOC121429610 [Lytechinus variegatus]XP_041482663.1 uncharacterized protein LOC121429610 [Lytechinus variegatus]